MNIDGLKGFSAQVDEDLRLWTKTTNSPLSAEISLKKGLLFRWLSTYAATAADYVLCLKNTDPSNNLRINKLIVSNSVDTIWTSSKITAGTPAGTAITGVNMNFNSGKTAVVTALGNAAVTGITGATALGYFQSLAKTSLMIDTDGALILPANTTWALKASATGTIYVFAEGWFEPEV